MMKQNFALLVLGIVSTGLFSCRHARHIARSSFPVADTTQHATPKDSASVAETIAFNKNLLEKIHGSHIDFNTFSGKLKVDFETDKKSMNGISANIRMKKDSLIWISVSAPIIGEAARAIITPDSLKAINKLEKTVILRDLKNAQDVLNIPFDFKTLQDIIIGNPIFLTDSIFSVVKTQSVISFTCESDVFTSLFNVFADDYVLQQSKVMDRDSTKNRSCELTYGEYKTMDGRKFATRRRVFVEAKGVTKINMEFNKVDFNQPVSMPFSVPANYSKDK